MLPKLTEFVDKLIVPGHQGLLNRRDFNKRPHYYLSSQAPYHLTDADRLAFMTFNPNEMMLHVRNVMQASPATYSDEDWISFFDWVARLKNFLDWWEEQPEETYYDTLTCDGVADQGPLYMAPEPRVFKAELRGKNASGENVVFIAAEGILSAFEVTFQPKVGGGAPVKASSKTVAADSTFRCNHITATAALVAGDEYDVVVENHTLPKPEVVPPKRVITAQ